MTGPVSPCTATGGRRCRPAAARFLRRLVAAVTLPAGAIFLGFGWYYSGRVRDGMTVRPASYPWNVRIDAVLPGSVTLSPLPDAPAALGRDTFYGLGWGTGFGQVDRLLARDGDRATRRLTGLTGSPPRAGQHARLTKDAFPDPATALRQQVRDVTISSAGRDLPAWLVPGPSTTWAVLVHGKGATRAEMLRLMRTTTGLGMPSLDISYRRDAETGGGLMRFGLDEWPDLEAGVRHALDGGARAVVLLACSSGVSVVASFLQRSPLRASVVALVLDSPNLDVRATIAHAAAAERLPLLGTRVPGSLVWLAEQLTGVRVGVDFRGTDYLTHTRWLTVPTLVFHGTADDTVPPVLTERLTSAAPELVRSALVEGAGHVESWNVDPRWYDTAVRRFLAAYVD